MNAVAGIGYIAGDSLWCTGQLLATVANDETPYLLTANHCVPNQNTAKSAEVYWRYQTAVCNSGSPPPLASVPQSAVTELLAGNGYQDFSLLMVEGALPAGATWAGWSSATSIPNNTELRGIHHPQGTFKRFSLGVKKKSVYAGYLLSEWYDGITQVGSSGSGIFLADTQQLVGQLCCGLATCAQPHLGDDYGIFGVSYQSFLTALMQAGSDDSYAGNDGCAAAAALGPGTHADLVVKSTAEDWFAIDLAAGEELTHDWATTDDLDYEVTCNCGAANCRGTITGKDWMKPELQRKYAGWFSWFLQRKIDATRGP